MNISSSKKLAAHLKPGGIYRRNALRPFSKAIDRDLMLLVKEGQLEKIGAGLYYRPAISRFGALSPNAEALVASFLKERDFLLYSWNIGLIYNLGTFKAPSTMRKKK